jgi:hypothetical protein
MLKQFKTILAFAALLIFFTACGEHNQPAPNKGKNLESERIYGTSREAEPAQLPNKYDDPENAAALSKAVYTKMYAPREAGSTKPSYITTTEVKTVETTPTDTTTTQN